MVIPIQFIGETQNLDAPESSITTNSICCTFFHEEGTAYPKISRIIFNFKCRAFYNLWQPTTPMNSSPTRLLFRDQIALPIKETFLQMTGDQNFSRAKSLIDDHLQQWRPFLVEENRKILTLFALKKSVEAVQSMPDEFNAVKIDIPVKLVQNFIFWQPMEMNEVHMRPTAELAIDESLKGAVVMEKMNCVVCLEEMESGTEGKEMPCSHVFHEDCITRWLRTSHYCPICRFELPMA